MWTAVLRGPGGGPAAIEICLVTPAEAPGRAHAMRLSARERALLHGRGGPEARADVLAGRLAAHALLGRGFEVLSGRRGEPIPSRGGRRARGLAISVAHSRGFGMAGILREAGWSIGVDVESRADLPSRLNREVLTPRERRRAIRPGAAAAGRSPLAHWALKEAALKARGGRITVGMLRVPGVVEVLRFGRDGWCRLRLPGGISGIGAVLIRPGVTMAVALVPR